jgi:hypothetical protein
MTGPLQPRESDAGLVENIRAWRAGEAKLDTRAIFDECERRFGPDTPTNYLASLLLAEHDFRAFAEGACQAYYGTAAQRVKALADTARAMLFPGGGES